MKTITIKRELIEGVYCATIPYVRFEGMTFEDFRHLNDPECLEKPEEYVEARYDYHSGSSRERERSIWNMYTDIIEGD